MKICVTSTGPDLDAQVDPRFGRCQYFIFADSDTLEFEGMQNPYTTAGAGAGIQTGQLMANKGVEVILTGNCGPNAYRTLQAAGIQVVVGASGTVGQAIESFKKGELGAASQPNVPGHFGMGMGTGAPGQQPGVPGQQPGAPGQPGAQMPFTPGMGMGGGMGGGMGRGMGMGGGMMAGPDAFQQPGAQPQMSKEQELAFLKQQAQIFQQQLEGIRKRLEELEG